MPLEINEISYSELISKKPNLKEYNALYTLNLSSVVKGFRYYEILNDKGKLVSCFGILVSKRMGFSHASNCPFFQDIGLWINYSDFAFSKQNSTVKKILEALTVFLNNFKWINITLPYNFKDTQPLIWGGLNSSPRYTYLLDLTKADIEKDFGKGLLHSVQKIGKTALKYTYNLDEEVKALVAKSSLKNRTTEDKKAFKKLMEEFSSNSSVSVFKCAEEGSVSAAIFIVIGDKAIYLFGGSEKKSGSVVGSAVLLKAIENFKNQKINYFDFEGSMIPGVEKFFRSFGAELIPLFNITKEPRVIRILKSFK